MISIGKTTTLSGRDDLILDRPVSGTYPIYAGWQAACTSNYADEWAVAHNLAMDARVEADDLAHALCSDIATCQEGGTLNDGLSANWRDHYLQQAQDVRFVGKTLRMVGGRRLLHIENFGSLIRRLSTGVGGLDKAKLQTLIHRYLGSSTLIPARGAPTPAQITEFAVQVNSLAAADFRDMLADLLLLLPLRTFWWAGLSDEVKAFRQDARELVSAFGLGAYTNDEWLLTYDYPASFAGLLYLPTIAEAADYAFHFPSPLSTLHGLTMPLSPSRRPHAEYLHHALHPLTAAEYVHPALMRVQDWIADSTDLYEDMPHLREKQWSFLRKTQKSTSTNTWLERHIWRDEARRQP